MNMATVSDYRRENLRKLIDNNGGPLALATKLGYVNSSFLVQMAGPSPIRDVTEKTARAYEEKLGLEPMSLDKEVDLTAAGTSTTVAIRRRAQVAPAPEAMGTADIGKLIQLVGTSCDAESVTLPNNKFADIIALALADAARNNNVPNEDYIKQLVRLTK
ncbi:transcriptional repressor [Curvibacter phage PCA1]|nr:transcriptional repressor [Curvibacter phage PCA1]